MTWLIGSRIGLKAKGQRPKYKKSFSLQSSVFSLRSKHGFTLIELLVVIIIISTLALTGLPRFRGTFNNIKFDNFCQDLTSRMIYLKERSSVEGNIYRMFFDLNNKNIEIEVKEQEAKEFAESRGILGRKIHIPEGIDIEIQEDNVIFYPDGSISGKDIHILEAQNKATIFIKEAMGSVKLENNE